jgi:hypothetical protein
VASIGDENAGRAPAQLTGSGAMLNRRRFKQLSFKNRLALLAKNVSEEASQMPSGPEREDMPRRARQAETASHLDGWINSPGLQPPEEPPKE